MDKPNPTAVAAKKRYPNMFRPNAPTNAAAARRAAIVASMYHAPTAMSESMYPAPSAVPSPSPSNVMRPSLYIPSNKINDPSKNGYSYDLPTGYVGVGVKTRKTRRNRRLHKTRRSNRA